MAKKYGVTWWGQQWLQSLTLIDYSQRLPRGKAIAITGKVRSLDIKGNQINARVQGAQVAPIRVGISVPLFTEAEKERFLEAIANDNALTLKLIKQELPQELRQIADKLGMKIFPESWKDFSMSCSCDDYSTPCEHLAAVIYEIAEEIDRNPFTVFEMHEMSLMKELDAYYQRLENKQSAEVAVIDRLLEAPTATGEFINVANSQPSKPLKPQVLDFTTIPEAGTQILMLFRANEYFNGVEIKEVLHQCYADASEAADLILRGDIASENLAFRIFPEDHLQLIFDENLLFKTLLLRDISGRTRPLTDFRPEDLVQLLYNYDFATLNRSHPNTVVLLHVFSFALNLAKNGTIVPQILECSPGKYRVRWIPALMVQEVREFCEKLAPSLSPDFLLVEKNGVRRSQSKAEMLKSLCAFFIGYCVEKKAVHDTEPLVQLFQHNAEHPIQSLEPDTAQHIHRWLNNFYITKKDYVPIVKVEETNGQYSVDLGVEYRPTPLMPPIPLGTFASQKKYEAFKEDVQKDMALLVEFFPQIKQILDTEGKKKLSYNPTRFMEVLLKNLPAIELFGIKTLLPQGMKDYVRPQISLVVSKPKGRKSAATPRFVEQFVFEWQIALGSQLISIEEFEKLVSSENGVVKLNGQFILVDEDHLIGLFEKLEEPPQLTEFERLQVMFTEQYRGAKISFTPEAEAQLKAFLEPRELPLPKKLNAEMLPYQLAGYDWMMKNARQGYGSLLADDMGLGKTVQVIAALLKFKDEGLLDKTKALIVVPSPMVANWRYKIRKYAPMLNVSVYHGKKRPLNANGPDVFIVSYETAGADIEMLHKMPWHCIIADEAQWVGDSTAEASENLKSLPAAVRLGIIGRDVENRLGELWSIMDFLNPGYLGSPKEFKNRFELPILRENDQRRAALLKKVTAPFLMRRMKTDKEIIPDLPDRIQSDLFAGLSLEQEELYITLVHQDLKLVLAEKEDARRQTIVNTLFKDLRKICNHPYQFTRNGPKGPSLSGKAQLLLDLLENSYDNGEKTLVITQFLETGELLTKAIKDAFGKEPLFLHPAISMLQRDEMVFNFQKNPIFDTIVLVTSPTSAGMNLTAAGNVVLFDRWWNNAMETLVTEKNSRIAQPKSVMLWRMTVAGTFEEKLHELMKTKNELADLTMAAGENWIGELSVEELEYVFG